jgi:hypothetical protein
MRKIATILFLLFVTNAYAQFDFNSDSLKSTLYPEIVSHIGKLDDNYDFQLRFWIHGGIAIPDQKNLFVMSNKNGIWSSGSYNFINHKRKSYKIEYAYSHQINCDSVWNYFQQNNILYIPNMDSLKDRFYFITENGDTAKIQVLDGLEYTFEFITPYKYKRIEYHCPITYSKKYTHINELQNISNIIKMIYQIMGIPYEPC